jgi:cell division protein FtsB
MLDMTLGIFDYFCSMRSMMVQKLLNLLKNKYVITILVFFFWVLLFDSNNLMERFRALKRLEELEREIQYYSEKIHFNQERIRELQTDKKNLEKFAREQYLMKKDDEDIFIIEEK